MDAYILGVEKCFSAIPQNEKFFTLEELQECVGGYIEMLTVGENLIMVLNENGKLEGLERNPLASYIAHHYKCIQPYDYIVGDVLLCMKSMIK